MWIFSWQSLRILNVDLNGSILVRVWKTGVQWEGDGGLGYNRKRDNRSLAHEVTEGYEDNLENWAKGH